MKFQYGWIPKGSFALGITFNTTVFPSLSLHLGKFYVSLWKVK